MKKIELEIVALSHSITQTHSYAVVLGEMNGLRRLPIVIGGFEAQAIAVALEHIGVLLVHEPGHREQVVVPGVERREVVSHVNDMEVLRDGEHGCHPAPLRRGRAR